MIVRFFSKIAGLVYVWNRYFADNHVWIDILLFGKFRFLGNCPMDTLVVSDSDRSTGSNNGSLAQKIRISN